MKKMIAVVLALVLAVGFCAPASALFCKKEDTLRLVVPENWEMDIGDSRTVEPVFSGSVKHRTLTWNAEPASVATVDSWGRVTAKGEGTATITAGNRDGLSDSVTLTVVKSATKSGVKLSKVDYNGEAVEEGKNLQKIVTRYDLDDERVPAFVKEYNSSDNAVAVTADGAKWSITNYGVLRVDENAENERDKEQRFMGDRYFYSADTTDGKVLAILADGENGIWTVMAEGYSHIEMKAIGGADKAAMMSDESQKYVARRGMVSNADLKNGEWVPEESDNDGLWTSMYGAGELMRYAVLKNDPTATKEEIAAARKTAYLSTEAVLLLTYISMRTGTVESLVHAQRNGSVSDVNVGKWYGADVLKEGGDYSMNIPGESPAEDFEGMYKKYMRFGTGSYVMKKSNLELLAPDNWISPRTGKTAKRTRLLEGFWSRTYSFRTEDRDFDGYIHWSHNGDGTATGMSNKPETDKGYLLNGENLRGVTVDASGSIPERLWNDLIGSGYDVSDIIYKGDTSADEIIGHVFLYKLAYDILGEEDPEIKELIARTMDSFAQHIVDNSYSLCDGSGQPTTWGKFSRTYFHNGQVLGGAPLQSAVILTTFKVAAYVTGDQKWEDEYRMAALDPAYEYAKIMTQELDRYNMSILEYANGVSPILGYILRPLVGTKLFKFVYRLILNYSDEEMAMLAYYTLFQLEDDEELLSYYREGLNDWWYSISHSENPCWYYIYQLAYPNEEQTDVYGNSLIETASWSLSRHPIDLRRYLASNSNRDDIAEFNLESVGIDGTNILSYDPNGKKPFFSNNKSGVVQILGAVLRGGDFTWKVAAPDERELHKFNGSTYRLGTETMDTVMEGSTTYTLPYWMGRYHGMLK